VHPDLIAFRRRHRAIGGAEVLGVIYGDSITAVRPRERYPAVSG